MIPDTHFTPYDRALPEYEEFHLLKPITAVNPENQARTIDLAKLMSIKEKNVPVFLAGIPNDIYRAEIGLYQNKVVFRGAIRCSKPRQDPKNASSPPMPPMISLENLELDASYEWKADNKTDTGLTLRLEISLSLFLGGKLARGIDPEIQFGNAAQLWGQVQYDKGKWEIEASVYDLSISHLMNFWHTKDRDSILTYLGKIDIDFVTIKYEFGNKGNNARTPTRLSITGQFEIADVAALKIDYTNRGGNEWIFLASLGASENKTAAKATVGKLMLAFLDATIVNLIPDAVKAAEIKGAGGEDALPVLCARDGEISVFACLVSIRQVSVWFIQLHQGNGPVKRIIKAAISKISVDVSAFQTTINSPWEDVFFMWVQDGTVREPSDKTLPGITQEEYDGMSKILKDKAKVSDAQLMPFKPKVNKSDTPGSTEVAIINDDDQKKPVESKDAVIAAGSHIVIVAKKMDGKIAVVSDHLFKTKEPPPKGKDYYPNPERGMVRSTASKTQPDPSGAEKGVKAPFKVKFGPLSIANVGLWYKDGLIGISLDATLIMGPFGLSLLGFSIGVPFGNGYSLQNPPPPSAIQWGLQGLILSMDKPPLTIAGGFMRDTSDPKIDVMYTGGLIVGFKPWSFEAMGAYANVKKTLTSSGQWITTVDTRPLNQLTLPFANGQYDNNGELSKLGSEDEFTFAFIYVKMKGPLFSVGFADIAGLVGGFGMNSNITLPTIEQVVQFPFVAERDSGEESSPVERMQGLMKGSWFRPAEGLYWAAAGARVTAFQMLAANIVFVIQFGNGALLFGIFGVATLDAPALESTVKFAHVELGIVCTFDVNSGIFKLEAQLSPRSFILAPQCHLTGGMAIFSWTKGDFSDPKNIIQAGDWVLTVGGYHRAFHPPRQYPKPPRLGISWSLDSSLSVTGEAYFAITPKVCMGGGRIHASLSLGALYAWFDAFLDFLMNFEPFFFHLHARVAIGVRFTLDLWLVTVRISCEISAQLDLTGPSFGGIVHVDFWVFGFDI